MRWRYPRLDYSALAQLPVLIGPLAGILTWAMLAIWPRLVPTMPMILIMAVLTIVVIATWWAIVAEARYLRDSAHGLRARRDRCDRAPRRQPDPALGRLHDPGHRHVR